MDTKLKVRRVGGSIAIFLPKVYAQHVKIEKDSDIIMRDDKRSDGRTFISFWKEGE